MLYCPLILGMQISAVYGNQRMTTKRSKLRNNLIRVAYQRPELREHLLPIIKASHKVATRFLKGGVREIVLKKKNIPDLHVVATITKSKTVWLGKFDRAHGYELTENIYEGQLWLVANKNTKDSLGKFKLVIQEGDVVSLDGSPMVKEILGTHTRYVGWHQKWPQPSNRYDKPSQR